MKKALILVPVCAAAAGAAVFFAMKKPKAEAAPKEKKAAPAAKSGGKKEKAAAPKAMKSGSYTFISGFQNAAEVEMSLQYDSNVYFFEILDEDFLTYSSDSHVAVIRGEDFSMQLEYAGYYGGEDFNGLAKSVQERYQGFDPNSIDSYIIFELMQNQYMDNSLRFATMVQQRFVGDNNRSDRGVRQAGFWVLLKSACPSVLIEMGFVSNKEEEKYLGSDKGKREITDAIFNAFATYYQPQSQTDKKQPSAQPDNNQPSAQPEQQKKNQTAPEPSPQATAQPKPNIVEPSKQKAEEQTKPTSKPAFTVQLFASRNVLKKNDREFKGLKGCFYIKRGEWYKYMYGEYATEQAAKAACQKLDKDFRGCFVVPFPDDARK